MCSMAVYNVYVLLFLLFRNSNAMKKFSDMGAATKETPLKVAEASDVVITMLPSSSHVSALFIHSLNSACGKLQFKCCLKFINLQF